MRIFSFVLLLTLCLTHSVSAIAPLNSTSIQQAQLYGSSQSKTELTHFLKPWLSYEEKAEQLNETAETAYLYTPFLLIATDAREKTLQKKKPTLADAERLITDYLDTMSFSVKLLGGTKGFSQHTTGVIKQEGKLIKAWSNAAPEAAEPCSWIKNAKFIAQCYFYFNEKELDLKKPITLVITSGDKKEHSFYFELDKIK